MSKVIKFPKVEAEAEDTRVNDLIDSLKENLDQLIFLKVEPDGNVAIGHTPLSNANVALMFYHIQSYLSSLLQQPQDEETYH